MKQFWFKTWVGVFMVAVLGMAAFLSPGQAEAYQAGPTAGGISVTVTYSDPINVRSGPSTILYPVVAQLNPGEVVPALGISPGREWIQVSYPGGTGWVYASFVSISGGELGIVEPPPTPTPDGASSTPDTRLVKGCDPRSRQEGSPRVATLSFARTRQGGRAPRVSTPSRWSRRSEPDLLRRP